MTGPPQYRLEDDRFLTGHGRFVEDLASDGCLHAFFVRTPHAHARIEAIDVAAASVAPGVAAVLTGADLAAAGLRPIRTPVPIDSFDGKPFHEPERHALAIDRVRFVGEPVILVLAETAELAADAGELVLIDYAEEQPQLDPAQSADIAFTWKLGDEAATKAAMAGATHLVAITEVNNRLVAAPVEPRSAIASHDAASDTYILRTQTQGVHFMRRLVADSLDIAPERLRVVTPDVGGSFGMKLVAYPEQVAMLVAARLTGRPVRWVATRSESMLSDTHARDHVSESTLALDEEGRFLGLEVMTHGNLGAYASAFASLTVSIGFSKTVGSVYRLPALSLTVRAVYTNTAPTDAYRGAGKPESVHLMERLVDKAAAETGIDRFELRRRNFVAPAELPCTAATGIVWKDADFPAVLARVLAESDLPGFAARRAQSAASGRLRGYGLGMYLHISGGVPDDTATVELEADGGIAIRTGSQDIGQGQETTFAQIVAGRLGIDITSVRVRQGDSEDIPPRTAATGGSSALQIAGISIFHATDAMIENLLPHAGEAMEAAAADIDYGEGKFTVRGTDLSIGLADLARQIPRSELTGCAGSADFSGNHVSVPNGAYACEVEVDPDIGHIEILSFTGVDDAGTRLNPAIVAGQLHGGIAQGIGAALLERIHYDENGQLLTGSAMDYAMPRAGDMPAFTLHEADIPNSHNPLGAKGVGELGSIGAPAAVMNAVADATGRQDIMMPATPQKVWRALERSGGSRPLPL